MRITALVSLAAALLAFTEASPIARRPHTDGHSIPVTRRSDYKHNTKAQIAKLNRRYPGINILSASSGSVALTDVSPDTEVTNLNPISLSSSKVQV